MDDCLFCKIIRQEIPATILFQDDQVMAFADIDPKAPHHILIIPHRHIATLNDMTEEDNALMGHMIFIAKELAREHGLAENGYRLVMNCNQDGGQAVFHIHLHLLGGRPMAWPPG